MVQSGGFGNFSKHYGTAAASLLEAEVVTADGKICMANACTNPGDIASIAVFLASEDSAWLTREQLLATGDLR